jgi:hypothetical protein
MPSENSPSLSDGFGVAHGRLKLRAGVALAALHLNVFSHELPLATVQIRRDGFAPLVLRELMAVALTLGATTSDMALADVAALANVRFAQKATLPRSLFLTASRTSGG